MPIFDIPKERLSELGDADLRELVARLAEAERVARGGHRTEVSWGGAQTAPDGGIDVEAKRDEPGFSAGAVLKRPWVGIQVKRGAMGPGDIKKEMRPDGDLRPVIADLAQASGSYLIVSGAEDCSRAVLERRTEAMREAVADEPNEKRLHTDFIDCGQLATWLRDHPGVVLWARDRLGLPALAGWHPHGRWTATPAGASDDLICGEGLTVHLPGRGEPIRSIPEALDAIRALVRESRRAIRIAGLSGVGKSRLVQALFEEGAGGEPLPRSQAIYADVGAAVEPRAERMLDILIERGEPVVLVVDNCPPDAHARLAERLVKAETAVRLVTVEYDVRDDRPETTDVVRIEAEGSAIAERLVRRRHPCLAQLDARRVAEFAGGNARLALALAHASRDAGTLSAFSDAQLFDRLFEQRQERDLHLKEAAEALSLVVSFHAEGGEADGMDELEVLGSLIERSTREMRRAVRDLQDRGLAQARGPWRAVLPQALANRLAREALRVIPPGDLDAAFGCPEAGRLLTSFSRRLAQLHDVPEAAAIVRGWLAPGGPLSDLRSEGALDLLATVAHLAPNEALRAVEGYVAPLEDEFALPTLRDQEVVVRILRALAHDPERFGRACALLLRLVTVEAQADDGSGARHALRSLFTLYLSGTMARTAERIAVLWHCLLSLQPALVTIGAEMLDAALENQHWSGVTEPAYDTRPDAHGWMPDEDEALTWFEAFIAIGAEGGTLLEGAGCTAFRKVLARRFRGLWMEPDLRAPLEGAARRLHAATPWVEGWHAVRETLYYDAGRGMACREAVDRAAEAADRPRLEALAADLEPRDLASQVLAILHDDGTRDQVIEDASDDSDDWERARKRVDERARDLGRRCTSDPRVRARLGVELFAYERQHLVAFGEGLGEAAPDMTALWEELHALFATVEGIVGNASVLAGFLDAIRTRDDALAERILEACAHDPTMRQVLGDLVPRAPTTARDLERVTMVLHDPRVPVRQFSWLVSSERCGLDDEARVRLLASMLRAEGGPGAVIDALMRLRYRERTSAGGAPPRDWPDALRRVGLQAVVRAIEGASDRSTSQLDHSVARALRVCLRPGDDRAAGPVIDAILAREGRWWRLEETVAAVATTAPVAFLDRALLGSAYEDKTHFGLFSIGSRRRDPLAEIPPEVLVAWCRAGKDARRWPLMAGAIDPFEPADDAGLRLSSQAHSLLDEAPDPALVVERLSSRLRPDVWSGDLADLVEARTAALDVLQHHRHPDVRAAIGPHLEAARQLIARYRQKEHATAAWWEQRFE